MLKKRLFSLLLVFVLLAGTTAALADAGGKNDPLVSVSYAKSWSQSLLDGVLPSVKSTLTSFYEKASKNAIASLTSGTGSTACSLAAGGTIRLSTGSSVILTSGSANMTVNTGTVVNVSVGSAASSGKLNPYHRYIACENSTVTVTASSASTFLVDGTYTKSDSAGFTDVKPTDWFYADVMTAVENGLINGMTATTFSPDGELTVAQAIKLAACMHQLNKDGAVTLTNGSPWYQSYLDYAVRENILDSAFVGLTEAQYNAAITRRDYVLIFYHALPSTEYAQINSIADGAIPDVKAGDAGADEIYAFYRAGILTGSGDAATMNWFLPDTNIARREVATTLTRMFDDTARKTFSLS